MCLSVCQSDWLGPSSVINQINPSIKQPVRNARTAGMHPQHYLLLHRSSGLLRTEHSIWSWVPITHLLIDSGPRLQHSSSPLWWFQPWPNLVLLYRVRQPLRGLCAATAMLALSFSTYCVSLCACVRARVQYVCASKVRAVHHYRLHTQPSNIRREELCGQPRLQFAVR